MLDPKEIDIEIARLEYAESSYPNYAKLANLYTIKNQMNKEQANLPQESKQLYSFAANPVSQRDDEVVPEYGNSEFYIAISGKKAADAWRVIDELLDTLSVANPRLYRNVLGKIYRLAKND